MTPSYIRWVVGNGAVILWQSLDYSSKSYGIVEVGEAVSLPHSLLLHGDMGRGEPHSLLDTYA